MNKYILFTVIFFALTSIYSCTKKNNADNTIYPKSKIWAHRTNDTTEAKQKCEFFDGLEIDVFYSSFANELYVCHNEEDTISKLTLQQWFNSINDCKKCHYWIDTKNLSYDNANSVAQLILEIASKYNIKDRIFVESYNKHALKQLKKSELHTLLWVENMNWEAMDTTTWYNNTKSAIEFVQPDAISCEYGMFPLLCDTFPKTNVHFWHTPAKETPENVELTRQICQKPNVKVVLVDYELPIEAENNQ